MVVLKWTFSFKVHQHGAFVFINTLKSSPIFAKYIYWNESIQISNKMKTDKYWLTLYMEIIPRVAEVHCVTAMAPRVEKWVHIIFYMAQINMILPSLLTIVTVAVLQSGNIVLPPERVSENWNVWSSSTSLSLTILTDTFFSVSPTRNVNCWLMIGSV
jgi:hypothetical protein